MKADLHFHTTLSDGRDRPEQVLANLVSSGVEFATLTDHDLVSEGFADELRARGIETTPASEISTHFFAGLSKVGLHMTAYAPAFSEQAHAMLQRTRAGKAEKIRQQVERLIGQGYPLSHEGLAQWAIAKGYNPAGLNNAHLSSYVYSTPGAIELANRDQQRKRSQPDRVGFLNECLKREGRNPIGAVEIPEYEPTTEEASRIVRDMGGVISIAHPNFSWEKYEGIEGLQRDIAQLVDQGVMGIELNALATPEWAKVILEIRDRYNLLLTFGSDNHGEKTPSKKHGTLGQMNPYFLEEEGRVKHHLKALRDRLRI
ncbi:PHP domain-containing protein [Candidatus Gracilibacteria bacterium]|nr:PHP domain-containing protein [Candidatus Gracilibacteria bacterium]